MFLLVPAYPCWPGQTAIKWLLLLVVARVVEWCHLHHFYTSKCNINRLYSKQMNVLLCCPAGEFISSVAGDMSRTI